MNLPRRAAASIDTQQARATEDTRLLDELLNSRRGSAPFARSYRRLVPSSPGTYVSSICLIVGLQVAALRSIIWVGDAFAAIAVYALRGSGIAVATRSTDFLGSSLTIALVDIRPPSVNELIIYIVAGITVVLCARINQQPTPLRYLLVFAALVAIGSAVQLLLAGSPAYECADFSALWLRSSLLMWALVPTLLGCASLLFPFRLAERALLIGFALAFDLTFSILRHALILAFISISGPTILPIALTFGGVVIDAIILVTLFSRSLASLSMRLAHAPELWRWSLR